MIELDGITIDNSQPFVLIAGPCVIESKEHTLKMAIELQEIAASLAIPFIFKSSYDKAGRIDMRYYRGPGLKEGLKILSDVKQLGIPVTSDIHETCQIEEAAKVLDIIQIPAFLCRQIDLVHGAAKTGLPVNIKKGQFMAPEDMRLQLKKVQLAGNNKGMLTERGTMCGYNLFVDFRGIGTMKEFCDHVIYDATHSVKIPWESRWETETLARAATATGIAGLFMEVHDEPRKALCDSECQFPLNKVKGLLMKLKRIDECVKGMKE